MQRKNLFLISIKRQQPREFSVTMIVVLLIEPLTGDVVGFNFSRPNR